MKRINDITKILLKKLSFKSKIFLLLFIPFITLVLLVYVAQNDETKIKVCYDYHTESIVLTDILKDFDQSENIEYVEIQQHEMEERVINGEFNLGIVFVTDIMESFESSDKSNLVEIISLEGNNYTQYIMELIYSSIYKSMTPYIAKDTMEQKDINESKINIEKKIDGYLNDDKTFKINRTIVGDASDYSSSKLEHFMWIWKIIVCIILTITTMLFLSMMGDTDKDMLSIYFGKNTYRIYSILPIVILKTCSIILAYVIIISWYRVISITIIVELIRTIMLLVILNLLNLILIKKINKEIVVVIIPFVIIFIITTHKILWDITKYYDNIEVFLNILPTYWYLN